MRAKAFRRAATAACAALLLGSGVEAQAWGALGHRVAGELAMQYLNDTTARKIRELLGSETLAEASVWADTMRSNPSHFWQKEAPGYHFVTVPAGLSYPQIGAPPQGDAVTALALFRRQLRDPQASKMQQQRALRFALHIVQDLQQPLHTGNGRDKGGGRISLTVQGKPSNFHRVWDSEILYSAGRTRAGWTHYLQTTGLLRTPRPADADPLVWIAESAVLRDSLYPPPRQIDEPYLREHLPRAELQLALAAIRSAAWLNETLSGTSETDADSGLRNGDSPNDMPWWRRWWKP
jgi:hypothetical protein